jgi:hypothetical protein
MTFDSKNSTIFEVIILGAGASGMMCACTVKGGLVALIDSSSRCGKKILVTGNGRCNLSNAEENSKFFNQNIDRFLKRFDQNRALEFFGKLGLVTFADEENRIYPLSNSAKSVVDVLNFGLGKNVKTFLGEKILSATKIGDYFEVLTDKGKYFAKKLVVCTGGNSGQILGELGVEYKKFIPSLVALRSEDCKDLNGVKVSNVKVKATNTFGQTKSEIGEVLFRENGLSGIVIFNLSTIFSRIENFSGQIEIDLLPQVSVIDLEQILLHRQSLNTSCDKFFVGMFSNAVANEIFKQSKTNTNKNCKNLTKLEIKTLAKTIKNLTFSVCGHLENNQVFSGGVPLSALTENLMHKKIENLYFAGEIVDVDGVCGGHNLQWAWTSGHIVGESL